MSSNFYEQDSTSGYNTLEKIELAEDLVFTQFTNVVGKFYYNAMNPTEDKSSPSIKSTGTTTTTNYIELIIPTHLLLAFVEPNFKKIKIDKTYYNLLVADNVSFTIPKGTIFVAELIGGRLELEKLTIIGLYILQE